VHIEGLVQQARRTAQPGAEMQQMPAGAQVEGLDQIENVEPAAGAVETLAPNALDHGHAFPRPRLGEKRLDLAGRFLGGIVAYGFGLVVFAERLLDDQLIAFPPGMEALAPGDLGLWPRLLVRRLFGLVLKGGSHRRVSLVCNG
jgi:hypothetical protein